MTPQDRDHLRDKIMASFVKDDLVKVKRKDQWIFALKNETNSINVSEKDQKESV